MARSRKQGKQKALELELVKLNIRLAEINIKLIILQILKEVIDYLVESFR
nr:MAG TPA: hypothetical protein [Bacteriophage sp.]